MVVTSVVFQNILGGHYNIYVYITYMYDIYLISMYEIYLIHIYDIYNVFMEAF